MPRKKTKQKIGRANGMGTVYKLSGNRRRPWVARITEGWEIEEDKEKCVRKIIGYFETEEEAELALAGHQLNPVPAKANITLEELYSEWKTIHFPKVSTSSVKAYEYGWRQINSIKNVKVKEIRRGQWEKIMLQMKSRGVGKASISHMLNIAGMLSTYAVQNDIIPRNYAEGIKPPKEEKKEKQPFNDFEMKKIKESIGKVPYAEHVLILCYTGLRIQELLNLTIFDVDFKKQTITGGLKTDAGRKRTVPIHSVILPHLRKIVNEATGSLLYESKTKGVSITQATFRKRYYEALDAMKIEKRSPHACRHTCATMMANSGVSMNAIKAILGHSNYAFTADRYTHLDSDQLLKEIENM